MPFYEEKKILILIPPGTISNNKKLWGNHSDIYPVYKNSRSLNARIKLRICLMFNRIEDVLNVELNRNNIDKYDIIIVNEIIYPEIIIKYIRQNNKHCEIIYWLWDSVIYSGKALLYDGNKHRKLLDSMRKAYNFKILSFDKQDCIKYGFIYHNQIAPFFEDFRLIRPIVDEVYFCGNDKGRLKNLKVIGTILKRYGIIPHFEVVPGNFGQLDNKGYEDFIFKVAPKSYEELLTETLKRTAILELVQKNQVGITWRALEALFYKRKLITNFKDIKNYDFYRPSNIFILGEDNEKKLSTFLSLPYETIPKEIYEKYTFEGCISHILE